MDLYMERESRGKYITVKRFKKTSSSTSSSTIKYSRRISQSLGHRVDLPDSPPDKKMPSDHLQSWLRDAHKFLSPPELYKPRPDPAAKKPNNKGQTPQGHHVPDSLSLAVSPGTRVHRQSSIPQSYSNDTSVPFVAAAQQLSNSIAQFKMPLCSWMLSKQHSERHLMASDFTHHKAFSTRFGKVRSMPAKCAPPMTGYNNDIKPRFQSEVLSFREVQSQVLSRIKALMTSNLPLLPQAAAHAYHDTLRSKTHGSASQDHDPELDEAQARHHAAETLRRKVRGCHAGLEHALDMMSRDHVYAKQAIRELKILKMQMITYRMAWDERYRDDGGLDSDEEDGIVGGNACGLQKDGRMCF